MRVRCPWGARSIAALSMISGCLVNELTIDGSRLDAGGGAGGEGLVETECADLFEPPWTEECASCVADTPVCCDLAAACLASPACARAAACMKDNTHPDGVAECGVDEPEGMRQWDRAWRCAREECDACGVNDFACVDAWRWPDRREDQGILWLRTFEVLGSEQTNFVARACGEFDLGCDEPLAVATASDAGGAPLVVDFHFHGHLETDATDRLFPMKIFPGLRWRSEQIQVFTPSVEEWTALSGLVGEPFLPGHGRLQFLNVLDCRLQNAANIRIEIGGADVTTPPAMYYFEGVLPVLGRTSTSVDGVAAAVNVPAGLITYRGYLHDTNELLYQDTVIVEEDVLTYVRAYPKRLQ